MIKVLASLTRTESFLKVLTRYYKNNCYTIPGKHGSVSFKLKSNGSKALKLHTLRASKPGMGDGSIVMNKICDLADLAGVTLNLTANPGYGSKMNREQLVNWYKKYGFTGNNGTLKRKPRRLR